MNQSIPFSQFVKLRLRWATRPRFSRPFNSTFEEIEREIERHRQEVEREFERHRREFFARVNADSNFPPMSRPSFPSFPALPPFPRIPPFDDQYAPRLNPDGRGMTIDVSLPSHVDPSKVCHFNWSFHVI